MSLFNWQPLIGLWLALILMPLELAFRLTSLRSPIWDFNGTVCSVVCGCGGDCAGNI